MERRRDSDDESDFNDLVLRDSVHENEGRRRQENGDGRNSAGGSGDGGGSRIREDAALSEPVRENDGDANGSKREMRKSGGCKLFVGGISHKCDDNRLRQLFEQFGTLTDVHVRASLSLSSSLLSPSSPVHTLDSKS